MMHIRILHEELHHDIRHTFLHNGFKGILSRQSPCILIELLMRKYVAAYHYYSLIQHAVFYEDIHAS